MQEQLLTVCGIPFILFFNITCSLKCLFQENITCPLKNQLPEKHHVTQTELLRKWEISSSVRGLVKANGERERDWLLLWRKARRQNHQCFLEFFLVPDTIHGSTHFFPSQHAGIVFIYEWEAEPRVYITNSTINIKGEEHIATCTA